MTLAIDATRLVEINGMSLRAAAHAYADLGWAVFPLKLDRTPATRHGFHDASTSHDQIDEWWSATPDAGIGIATGASGLAVADIDHKNGKSPGIASWEEWTTTHPVPDTVSQTTPSGGFHLVYAQPEGSVVGGDDRIRCTVGKIRDGIHYGIAEGVDTRGDGGYIVVSPTRDIEGYPYRWLDNRATIAPVPVSVYAAHLRGRNTTPPPPASTLTALADGDAVNARVVQLARELADAPEGAGNETAARIAYMVGQYVGAGQIDYATAEAHLTSAIGTWGYRRPGDYQGMVRTIQGQLQQGSRNPRPWGEAASWVNPLGINPGAVPTQPAPWQPPTTYSMAPVSPGHAPVPEDQQADPVQLMLQSMITSSGLDSIPPPEWLVEGMIECDSTAWVVGEPGCGKSFVTLDLAHAVATGRPWHGHAVKQGLVIIMVGEGTSGIRQRVRAVERHYRRTMSDTEFMILPFPVQIVHGEWRVFVDAMRILKPALVIVDTQARATVGVEENSNTDMGMVIDRIEYLRRETKATVLTVHHVGKAGAIRGASSIDGAATTILRVEKTSTPTGNMITLKTQKQKNTDDQAPIRFRMESVVTDAGASVVLLTEGRDDQVRREVASVAADEGKRLVVMAKEEILKLGLETLDPGLAPFASEHGATKANYRKYARERIIARVKSEGGDITTGAADKRFDRAWSELVDNGRIEQSPESATRFVIVPVASMVPATTTPNPPTGGTRTIGQASPGYTLPDGI